MKKFRSCYHRYIKTFFGYDRLRSVTAIFLDLQLPSFDTFLYNYKYSFNMQFLCSNNDVVEYLVRIRLWCVYVLFLLFFLPLLLLLLFYLCSMDVSLWNKLDWLIDWLIDSWHTDGCWVDFSCCVIKHYCISDSSLYNFVFDWRAFAVLLVVRNLLVLRQQYARPL